MRECMQHQTKEGGRERETEIRLSTSGSNYTRHEQGEQRLTKWKERRQKQSRDKTIQCGALVNSWGATR
eukprot:m.16048 g.16048  ORF g.16048 m.16048 type:complete len:69 (-) comp6901_c0_seq1:41-247(-)